MSRILFIDDEQRRMEPYVEELRDHGHQVEFEADIDRAVRLLVEEPSERFDLVILDISLPTGKTFETADTDGGARTGLTLYDKLRSSRTDLHVVVFTNVPDQRILKRFRAESHCTFVRKSSVLPHQFADNIDEIVKKR